MSAIDRAFIKAYSDEQASMPEQGRAPSRASMAAEATAANPPVAETKPTAASHSPRKTAGRSKRSAAAAAIRAAEPAASDAVASLHQDVDSARVNASTASPSAEAGNKPKMVVGRRALQKLAESAVVPAPHMSFSQTGRTVSAPVDDHDASRGVAAGALGESGGVGIGQPPQIDSRVSEHAAPSPARPRPQQFRLDPAAATAALAQRMPNPPPRKTGTQIATPAALRATTVAPPNDLRPLSSYRTEDRSSRPLAALEVDRLVWPSACASLIERAASELESLAVTLAEHVTSGSQTIAIVSNDDGAGCTTVLLCIAQTLSQQGMRVCLVDGDLCQPQLAESLGLEPERGLDGVLAGEATLSEVLIESLEDRLTLLPLCKPLPADVVERSKLRQTVTFGELRDRFDVVLIDGGCVGSLAVWSSILAGGSIDAAILVGCPSGDTIAWQRARRALERWSVPCLGVIENRCTV